MMSNAIHRRAGVDRPCRAATGVVAGADDTSPMLPLPATTGGMPASEDVVPADGRSTVDGPAADDPAAGAPAVPPKPAPEPRPAAPTPAGAPPNPRPPGPTLPGQGDVQAPP